jgi:4-amino-4-deoxy-L-arabinose transferase-like glycosyltransferase
MRPANSSAQGRNESADLWPLAAILLVAFTARLLAVVSFTGAIDPEGAEYARIAENLAAGHGYYGIATPGKQLMFPPLFPLMIVATSLVTGDAELAGRLVSLLMGTLLVVPVFFMARHLYSRATASVAALLVAVHPYLIGFASTVYSETTYMTLALMGVYCCFRALHQPEGRAFAFAGALFGLAYLTRPEAAVYPFIALGVTLTYVFLAERSDFRRVALRSLWLPVAFLILAAPYVVWLRAETGQWRLEGKSPVNYTAGLRMLTGLELAEAEFGVERDLTERGVRMTSNLEVIQATDFDAGELASYLRAKAKAVLKYFLELVKQTSFGSPPLFFLALYGLFRRPWHRELAANHALLFIVLGASSSALLFIYYLTDRFLLLFVPVLAVWAANGILELAQWAASTLRLLHGGFSRSARVRSGLVLILVSVILVMTAPSIYHMQRANRNSLALRAAGEWLKAHAPGPKTVIDASTMLAFHATATFVPFPYADSDVAIRYLEKRRVNFVVLSDHNESLSSRPYLKAWMESGVPSPRAKLIYSVTDEGAGRIKIYDVRGVPNG